MFAEVGAQHHVVRFHAYFHDEVGIFSVDPVEIMPVPCRDGNYAWSKLGPNYIRTNCWPIGKHYSKEEPHTRLSR